MIVTSPEAGNPHDANIPKTLFRKDPRVRGFIVLIITMCILFAAGCISEKMQEKTTTTSTPVPAVTFIRPTIVQTQCTPLNENNNTCCILINPVGKHRVGDVFEINGTTNLGVDSKIILELSEPWMLDLPPGTITKPTPYYQYSGTKGDVKIQKGTDGIHRWSFQVDLSGYHGSKMYDLHVKDELNRCYDDSHFYINSALSTFLTGESVS